MTTDKTPATLATVKHGGCVQLASSERARFDAFLRDNPFMALMAGTAWQVWQAALSVQPSPGGQDSLTALVAKWRAAAAEHELLSLEADSIGLTVAAMRNDARHQVLEAAADELEAALAARQPETDEQYADEQALIDHLDSLMDDGGQGGEKWPPAQAAIAGIIAARQPVGEPVAWMTHHDEPMLFPTAAEAAAYCEDDEQPAPLFRSPAQAVDLGQFRPAVITALGHSSPYGLERENLNRLLALIDSHSAGGQP